VELIHEGGIRVFLGCARKLSVSIEEIEGSDRFIIGPELLGRVKVEIDVSKSRLILIVEPFLHVVEVEGVLWHERPGFGVTLRRRCSNSPSSLVNCDPLWLGSHDSMRPVFTSIDHILLVILEHWSLMASGLSSLLRDLVQKCIILHDILDFFGFSDALRLSFDTLAQGRFIFRE